MIEDGIEHETVVASVITSNKPSESCHIDCQIHTYFSHEKKSTHLLKLNLFPKESQETEVELLWLLLTFPLLMGLWSSLL